MSKKPKRPRAPKSSASYQTWQNYSKRLSDWKKRCSGIVSDKKKKTALMQKLRRVA